MSHLLATFHRGKLEWRLVCTKRSRDIAAIPLRCLCFRAVAQRKAGGLAREVGGLARRSPGVDGATGGEESLALGTAGAGGASGGGLPRSVRGAGRCATQLFRAPLPETSSFSSGC